MLACHSRQHRFENNVPTVIVLTTVIASFLAREGPFTCQNQGNKLEERPGRMDGDEKSENSFPCREGRSERKKQVSCVYLDALCSVRNGKNDIATFTSPGPVFFPGSRLALTLCLVSENSLYSISVGRVLSIRLLARGATNYRTPVRIVHDFVVSESQTPRRRWKVSVNDETFFLVH